MIAAICLFLLGLTVGAFWQLKDNAFINYDDNVYVTDNPQVKDGLSFSGLGWAFTATSDANWHPLTWLSHMLDWQLYGANPRGHHLTSLFFHVVNTILLLLVLVRFTNRLWPSALVAALFALHPLHVESVAWVAERKDVLSAFFWLLTMWAYLRYVERPGAWRYLAVIATFTLGLMAKPMLVTEPFVLLLLDYWPLNRWSPGAQRAIGQRKAKPAPKSATGRGALHLVWEKMPLFALAATSCAITLLVQKGGGAVASTDIFPFGVRLSNALVAYVTYLFKMVWPINLAVFYPHPGPDLPGWQIVGAGLLLVACTSVAIRWARRFPYLPVGWFWYLGTLVPVIGLVQVGSQAIADRYTYIPLIGIFIILAFGSADLVSGRRRWQIKLASFCSLALVICVIFTWIQVGYWRNSTSLFSHALAVTEDNFIAYDKLGLAYEDEGKNDEAIKMYSQAIRIDPDFSKAYNSLGRVYDKVGRIEEAVKMFRQAIHFNPKLAAAYNELGKVLDKLGKTEDAIDMFRQAIRLNPNFSDAHNNLGIDLGDRDELDNAIYQFQQAIRARPDYDEPYHNLGLAYYKQGKIREAREMFETALEINPDNAGAKEMLNSLEGR